MNKDTTLFYLWLSYKIYAMMIYDYNCRLFIFVIDLCMLKLVLS
jgi:hypothetical protein